MKTDASMKAYLEEAGGNVATARALAARDHDPRDQTLDAKWSAIDRLAAEEQRAIERGEEDGA